MIRKLAVLVASVCWLGFVPVAPGTVGSLAALALAWFLPTSSCLIMGALVLATMLFGLVATHIATKGSGDPSWVVIDEVAGMWLALVGLPVAIVPFALAFVLFRLLDIYKPCGIKHLQCLPGAWGVMFDDLAAGAVTALLVRAIFYIKPF